MNLANDETAARKSPSRWMRKLWKARSMSAETVVAGILESGRIAEMTGIESYE